MLLLQHNAFLVCNNILSIDLQCHAYNIIHVCKLDKLFLLCFLLYLEHHTESHADNCILNISSMQLDAQQSERLG